jgi:hypothetical protein
MTSVPASSATAVSSTAESVAATAVNTGYYNMICNILSLNSSDAESS